MNRALAVDWLNKAWHHFSSGKFLFEANHYTDVIAIDLHYAVEVTLKSILAFENKKIIKTHDLIVLSNHIKDKITFDIEEKRLLVLITTYHIKGSYPPHDRKMPNREEIKKVLDFASKLFDRVCKILDIDESEVKR